MPIRRTYGRIPDRYDPSDQRMHVGAAKPVPLVDFWSLAAELGGTPAMGTAHMPPVYDQGPVSSCTGNGTAALDDFTRHKLTGRFLTPSRLAIYYGAREREQATQEDGGAMIADAIQTVVKQGAAPESLWPYSPSMVLVKPSIDYYTEAAKHEVDNWSRVSQADYYIGHCLQILGLPVVFGIDLFPAFESDAVAATGMVPMPAKHATPIGGHCMVIVARDAKRGLYGVRNSWGVDWGIKGYCWMPRPYVLSQLASDFWAILHERG